MNTHQTIFHTVKTDRYTVIDNETIRDEYLSFRATGLLVFLLSLPDNWSTNMTHLTASKSEGRDAVKNALSELMNAGYVKRVQGHDDDGRFLAAEMLVRESTDIPWPEETPLTEKPLTVNPSTEKPSTVNPQLQKKEDTKDRDGESTEKEKTATFTSQAREIWDEYVESLKRFDPSKRKPVFTDARMRKIIDMLHRGYSVEDLKLAVTGWEYSDFHRGDNDGGKVYNTLELLLRNDEKIDQFIGYHDRTPQINSRRTISEKWGVSQTKTPDGNLEEDEPGDWDD